MILHKYICNLKHDAAHTIEDAGDVVFYWNEDAVFDA